MCRYDFTGSVNMWLDTAVGQPTEETNLTDFTVAVLNLRILLLES
jgi:hypothetical protein